MPTIIIFREANIVSNVVGANQENLTAALIKLVEDAKTSGLEEYYRERTPPGGALAATPTPPAEWWLGASLPKSYGNVTDEVDVKGLDLLNADSAFGAARVLFDERKPSSLGGGGGGGSSKGKEKASTDPQTTPQPDWVESDTDEQLMLFMPFQSSLKIHSLHLTSLPPPSTSTSDASAPSRPRLLRLYTNTAHVLGFDEADDVPPTQEITLAPGDWDAETGTARVELRFVKFQNVASLVLFVVEAEGGGDRVRLDRVRLLGDVGTQREMGKLEKIGDEPGE